MVDADGTSTCVFEPADRPLRLIVDKYARSAKANGSPYAISSFEDEREQTLIVYGTRDEEAANRETALAIQEKIRSHWSNQMIPVKTDQQVTDDDLRKNHLLLVGRPDTNRIVERFRDALPVAFGWRSFTVRSATYAHAGKRSCRIGREPAQPALLVRRVRGPEPRCHDAGTPLHMSTTRM